MVDKTNAWANQKQLQKKAIPSLGEVSHKLLQIEDKRARALSILTYQTAGRITEIVKGITKRNMQIVEKEDHKKFLIIDMSNLKNRRRHSKKLAIPIHKETDMILALFEYVNLLDDDTPIFNMSRQRAWQILIKHTGYNPHFLRHLRATHLVVEYDFNEYLLTRWMGWSDTRPAKHYMELRIKDFMDKL